MFLFASCICYLHSGAMTLFKLSSKMPTHSQATDLSVLGSWEENVVNAFLHVLSELCLQAKNISFCLTHVISDCIFSYTERSPFSNLNARRLLTVEGTVVSEVACLACVMDLDPCMTLQSSLMCFSNKH